MHLKIFKDKRHGDISGFSLTSNDDDDGYDDGESDADDDDGECDVDDADDLHHPPHPLGDRLLLLVDTVVASGRSLGQDVEG